MKMAKGSGKRRKADRRTVFIRVVAIVCALLIFGSAVAVAITSLG